jgi:hypothetical protein
VLHLLDRSDRLRVALNNLAFYFFSIFLRNGKFDAFNVFFLNLDF